MTRSMTNVISLAVALMFAVPLAAQAKEDHYRHGGSHHAAKPAASGMADAPMDFSVSEIRTEAKIVELDKKNRTAVLRTPQDKLVTVRISPKVRNFDQIKIGDELVIRYQVATIAEIEPASKTDGIRERIESTDMRPGKSGGMPDMRAEHRVEIVAIIEAINSKANTMTLRGATRTVTMMIPKNLNVGGLKVGDEVHALITEAMIVDIEQKPV